MWPFIYFFFWIVIALKVLSVVVSAAAAAEKKQVSKTFFFCRFFSHYIFLSKLKISIHIFYDIIFISFFFSFISPPTHVSIIMAMLFTRVKKNYFMWWINIDTWTTTTTTKKLIQNQFVNMLTRFVKIILMDLELNFSI